MLINCQITIYYFHFNRGVSIAHPVVQSLKEESSDESTIISSQTSTLTRNHGRFSPYLEIAALRWMDGWERCYGVLLPYNLSVLFL